MNENGDPILVFAAGKGNVNKLKNENRFFVNEMVNFVGIFLEINEFACVDLVKTVEILLKNGANINAANKQTQTTSLMVAAKKGKFT